ncbi:MAG: hypothetical protein ACFBZ8_05205 [Opitutales bacterium]
MGLAVRVLKLSQLLSGLAGLAFLGLGVCVATQTPAELDDPAVFPPALFPGVAAQPSDRIFWEGMAAVYPGRVLLEAPTTSEPLYFAEVKSEAITDTLIYRRPYSIQQASRTALKDLQKGQRLILDLRFIETTVEDLPHIGDFITTVSIDQQGAALDQIGTFPAASDFEIARTAPEIFGGLHPVYVLVNERTRGPLEAALASLQAQQAVLLIGKPTGGRTGVYRSYRGNGPEAPEVYLLKGELKTKGGESLIPGGVAPAIKVDITASDDLAAWMRYNEGEALNLLYSARLFDGENEENGADVILETALRVVSALQVLEGLPETN